jgi:hypothetical protein
LFPAGAGPAAGALFLSAALLSRLSPDKARLFKASAVFLLFWTLAALIMRGPGARGGFRPEALAACLFLGLHLFLVWTPARLGRGVRILARPLAGADRAALLGLTLTALAKVIPLVVADAVTAKRALRRVRGLGLRRRMALWGRAVARLALKRAGGLGRTLAKRQRDLA